MPPLTRQKHARIASCPECGGSFVTHSGKTYVLCPKCLRIELCQKRSQERAELRQPGARDWNYEKDKSFTLVYDPTGDFQAGLKVGNWELRYGTRGKQPEERVFAPGTIFQDRDGKQFTV
jgi:hypothetical protein